MLWCCMYLYLLLRKPGNDHRLVTTFDLISAQRPTSYYHLWQRILRRSPNAVQLCRKDSLAFTHSTFFCGEAMFEVRVCKRKRCLRNRCRRVGVVRPCTYPTQRVQCCHHVGQSHWLKSRHLNLICPMMMHHIHLLESHSSCHCINYATGLSSMQR